MLAVLMFTNHKLFACWVIFMLLLLFADFFQNKKNLSGISSVSNGLDPDQDRRSVGPDLGSIGLRRLSATTKATASK